MTNTRSVATMHAAKEGALSRVSRLRYLHLAYFAKPKSERAIYRRIRRAKMSRIVEIGVGDASRARRLIQTAQRFAPGDVQYVGVDQFEAATHEHCGAPLIQVHRALAKLGARVRLVPGDASPAIANVANSLANSDLILISADVSDEELAGAWFYFPRMLHSASVILRERRSEDGETAFEWLTPHDMQTRAERTPMRRAA